MNELAMNEDRPLTGAERAITLLLTLGEERAKSVVEHLTEQEIRKVTEALETMRSISNQQVEQVFDDFMSAQERHAFSIGRGESMMRRIATEVMGPEKADDLLARQVEAPSPLRLLNRIEPETLAGLLGKEHPQSLAALLAHADEEKASAVLSNLPDDVQLEVVKRMATLETIPNTTIQEAERALRDELALVAEAKVASIDGVKRAAAIVSRLQGEVSERLLDEIDDTDDQLALAIKRAMFTFEDLINVDNRDMQTLLREISGEQLKFGMKTASPELKEHILAAMSRRAAEMLLDDIDTGPVKLLPEDAQAAVVEGARDSRPTARSPWPARAVRWSDEPNPLHPQRRRAGRGGRSAALPRRAHAGGQPNFQRTTGVRLDETAAGAPAMPVDLRIAEPEALREQAHRRASRRPREARAMAEDEYRGRLQSSQATLERSRSSSARSPRGTALSARADHPDGPGGRAASPPTAARRRSSSRTGLRGGRPHRRSHLSRRAGDDGGMGRATTRRWSRHPRPRGSRARGRRRPDPLRRGQPLEPPVRAL